MPVVVASVGSSAAQAKAKPVPAWTDYVAGSQAPTGEALVPAVLPIDTSTNEAGAAIDVNSPNGSGEQLTSIAITPNGAHAFVATYEANPNDSVADIDTATKMVTDSLIGAGCCPESIAITPNGATAYVVGPSGAVTPVDTATDSVGTSIQAGLYPDAIAITPNGAAAYVSSFGDNTVVPVDLVAKSTGSPIPVGTEPGAIAITPNGATAYVTNFGSNTVTPINLATNTAEPSIPVGNGPVAIAITPNGVTAYVANRDDNTVTPIATASDTAGAPIPVGSPNDIAVTPDGSTAYVGSLGNSVTPIDTATNTVDGSISIGSFTTSAEAIAPDQAPVANLSVTPAEAGEQTRFDGSASTVAFGTISTYAWNFGDGSTATTSVPTTTHTYAAGTYTASVTETDSAGTSTTQVFTGQTMSRNGGPSAVASQRFVVSPALTITTASLPTGHAGTSYSTTLQATGGNPPYKWHLVSGSLPSRLRLHAGTGVISGTPKVSGTFPFTVQATDTKSNTKPRMQESVTKSFSLTIS
jgi:YVTN family beta-propeller protein